MRKRTRKARKEDPDCDQTNKPCSSGWSSSMQKSLVKAAVLVTSCLPDTTAMFADPRALRGNDGKAVETESFLFGHQNLVHTFGTPDSCARSCPRECVVQEVEDLMMPRWICPTKPASDMTLMTPLHSGGSEAWYSVNNQLLLIVVPVGLITVILLTIFLCRRCSSVEEDD